MNSRHLRSYVPHWVTGTLAAFLLLLGSGSVVWANEFKHYNGATEITVAKITGKVTAAEDGEPLIGVTVLVKGTPTGTVTDVDGTYTIDVDAGAVLVFSYTGYEPREVVVGAQTTIDVVLRTDAQILDEVVVVGYGTRKRSHNTGAIAQVDGGEVAAIQATAAVTPPLITVSTRWNRA